LSGNTVGKNIGTTYKAKSTPHTQPVNMRIAYTDSISFLSKLTTNLPMCRED
jgi:hypothetical protein